VRHRAVLVPLLGALMRERSRADWLAALDAAGVPCGPINTLDQVFADPQVLARGMVESVPHALADTLRLVASPLKLSATPARTRLAPPLLGQHTSQVLADWLGWESQRIHAVQYSGALGDVSG
jgi:crotonobetainyl-CoA:carnitine CoA-transferase CaiB-like acyl-CoA transferase